MISKYYSEHVERRKFYCIRINYEGKAIGGWVETVRASKNAYEIIKMDFNCPQGLILEKYINKVKRECIIADTQEIAEELFQEALERGLMRVFGGEKYYKKKINKKLLDEKYKELVDTNVVQDKGGYFKSK